MTIALIDADILVYESAHRCQKPIEWDPGQWTFHASMPEAQADFHACIVKIEAAVGAERSILALTDSDRDANFRRSLWPGYKDHREGPGDNRPLLYKALRQWIREEYTVKEKPGIEGDDTLGILATGDIRGLPPKDERVVCSVDKDMLTVPGRHYNWRKDEDGIREVDEDEAFLHHMYQTLTGDSTDGYPGLPGCGPVGATKILGKVPYMGDNEELWRVVVAAYEKKGLTEEDALIQARCARILQASDWDFENERVVLWTPPLREED